MDMGVIRFFKQVVCKHSKVSTLVAKQEPSAQHCFFPRGGPRKTSMPAGDEVWGSNDAYKYSNPHVYPCGL